MLAHSPHPNANHAAAAGRCAVAVQKFLFGESQEYGIAVQYKVRKRMRIRRDAVRINAFGSVAVFVQQCAAQVARAQSQSRYLPDVAYVVFNAVLRGND